MLNSEEERFLREIYQKYAEKLYRFLSGLSSGSDKISEDICQEVWISFARQIQRMESWEDKQILAWLRLMARVKYRRYIKKQEKRDGRPLETFLRDENCAGDSAEDIALLEILCKEKFSELTETEKELVRCKIYGISYRQTHPGDTRSENALAIRCSRAFRKWKRRIQEDGLEYS